MVRSTAGGMRGQRVWRGYALGVGAGAGVGLGGAGAESPPPKAGRERSMEGSGRLKGPSPALSLASLLSLLLPLRLTCRRQRAGRRGEG